MLNRIIAGLLFVLTAIGAKAAVSVTPFGAKYVDATINLWVSNSVGALAPIFTPTTNGSAIYANGFTLAGTNTQFIYGNCQISHGVIASNAVSYFEPHIHVSPTNITSGSNIAFTMIWEAADIGGRRIGPVTNVSQIGLTSLTFNNLIEFNHYTNYFPTLSAIFKCVIFRSNATSNNLADTVILDGADIHIQVDKLGSNNDNN